MCKFGRLHFHDLDYQGSNLNYQGIFVLNIVSRTNFEEFDYTKQKYPQIIMEKTWATLKLLF